MACLSTMYLARALVLLYTSCPDFAIFTLLSVSTFFSPSWSGARVYCSRCSTPKHPKNSSSFLAWEQTNKLGGGGSVKVFPLVRTGTGGSHVYLDYRYSFSANLPFPGYINRFNYSDYLLCISLPRE